MKVEFFESKTESGYKLRHISEIFINSVKKLNLPDKVSFYIELKNKIILLTFFPTDGLPKNKVDIYRNVFCYSKDTGELLWQIEQVEDSMFVNMWLEKKQEDGSYVSFPGEYKSNIGGEPGWKNCPDLLLKTGEYLFSARTFSCNVYSIDIETGKKIEWLYNTK